MLNALVVDDEESIRSLLAEELKDRGYRVREAFNGVNAIQCVGEEIPDIIFVDIVMPVMDGFEFISTLRENPGTSKEMGLKLHLTKPWESWALDSVLNQIFSPGS